jgi:phosphotransferase system enzyme I (PtsP)
MVEVPAAVYQARQLARRVDFLSVGSNDLTQYLLAVDRNNTRVADLYHAYHPAVLNSLQQVVDAAHAEGKPVGICGELAGDPAAVLLLMAMGYDMLSMNDNSLLRVKAVIRSCRFDELQALLNSAMLVETADEVKALLRKVMIDIGMERLLQPIGA